MVNIHIGAWIQPFRISSPNFGPKQTPKTPKQPFRSPSPLRCFGAVAQSQWKESRYDQSESQRTPKLFGSEVRLDEIRYNGMLFALRTADPVAGNLRCDCPAMRKLHAKGRARDGLTQLVGILGVLSGQSAWIRSWIGDCGDLSFPG